MRYKQIITGFTEDAIKEYKDRIQAIILFGSVARGTSKKDSDIDILVVEKGDRLRMRRNLASLVTKILLETGKYVSVKTLSIKDFRNNIRWGSQFIENILKEGHILYKNEGFELGTDKETS